MSNSHHYQKLSPCCIKSGSHMLLTCLGNSHRHGLGQCCGICEHLSATHILSQTLTTALPVKLSCMSSTSQASDQYLRTEYVSAITVHIIIPQRCPGHAGSYVPGRSAAYENIFYVTTVCPKTYNAYMSISELFFLILFCLHSFTTW